MNYIGISKSNIETMLCILEDQRTPLRKNLKAFLTQIIEHDEINKKSLIEYLNNNNYEEIKNYLINSKDELLNKAERPFNYFFLCNGLINPMFVEFLKSHSFGYSYTRNDHFHNPNINIYGDKNKFYKELNGVYIPEYIIFNFSESHEKMIEE